MERDIKSSFERNNSDKQNGVYGLVNNDHHHDPLSLLQKSLNDMDHEKSPYGTLKRGQSPNTMRNAQNSPQPISPMQTPDSVFSMDKARKSLFPMNTVPPDSPLGSDNQEVYPDPLDQLHQSLMDIDTDQHSPQKPENFDSPHNNSLYKFHQSLTEFEELERQFQQQEQRTPGYRNDRSDRISQNSSFEINYNQQSLYDTHVLQQSSSFDTNYDQQKSLYDTHIQQRMDHQRKKPYEKKPAVKTKPTNSPFRANDQKQEQFGFNLQTPDRFQLDHDQAYDENPRSLRFPQIYSPDQLKTAFRFDDPHVNGIKRTSSPSDVDYVPPSPAFGQYEANRRKETDERDSIQKKTFTKWVNKHLLKTGRHIDDLFEGLRDGHNLISLLEVLSHESLPRERGHMKFHKLQNIQICLDFLKYKGIKLVNIRPDEIVDGNPKLTLGLIWTIILHFQFRPHGLRTSSRLTHPTRIGGKQASPSV